MLALPYVAMQKEKKLKKENVQIAEMLTKIDDVTVKEGESLPNLKKNIEDMGLIKPDTLQINIQNVDVTVPGNYDIIYSFKDIHENERTKTVQCTVEADLLEHVYGMENIQTDCGEKLPEATLTYDEEYVSGVTRDDSQMDTDSPGSYPITYTILGTDGKMEESQYLATVLETVSDTSEESERGSEAPVQTQAVDSGNTGQAIYDHILITGVDHEDTVAAVARTEEEVNMIVRQEEQIFLLFFSAILIEADKMEGQCHRKDTVIFHKYLSCRNQGLMIRWK